MTHIKNYWIFFNGMVSLFAGSSLKFSKFFESYYVGRHREEGRIVEHEVAHPLFLVKFW